jgi:hypothetical protein
MGRSNLRGGGRGGGGGKGGRGGGGGGRGGGGGGGGGDDSSEDVRTATQGLVRSIASPPAVFQPRLGARNVS